MFLPLHLLPSVLSGHSTDQNEQPATPIQSGRHQRCKINFPAGQKQVATVRVQGPIKCNGHSVQQGEGTQGPPKMFFLLSSRAQQWIAVGIQNMYGIYKSFIKNVISATVLAMIEVIRLLNPKRGQELHHKQVSWKGWVKPESAKGLAMMKMDSNPQPYELDLAGTRMLRGGSNRYSNLPEDYVAASTQAIQACRLLRTPSSFFFLRQARCNEPGAISPKEVSTSIISCFFWGEEEKEKERPPPEKRTSGSQGRNWCHELPRGDTVDKPCLCLICTSV